MPRNGLTKERVVEAAARLIERGGPDSFSMRALAESLNVKTASLYNHIPGMDALMSEVCVYALQMQRACELRAIEEKSGPDGIRALAEAYRQFAKTHRELYRFIMRTAAAFCEQPDERSQCIVEPFWQVLAFTSLSETEKAHWQRVLRGIVHGFVSQEDAGFFAHLPADVDISFQTAINCYIDGLTQAEKRTHA